MANQKAMLPLTLLTKRFFLLVASLVLMASALLANIIGSEHSTTVEASQREPVQIGKGDIAFTWMNL